MHRAALIRAASAASAVVVFIGLFDSLFKMDNLTKLEYYRAETRHEFNLLGQQPALLHQLLPLTNGRYYSLNGSIWRTIQGKAER
jgi:hypothetical protein